MQLLNCILTSVIITSWNKKHTRQKRRRRSSRRPVLRISLGNKSMMDVITTSIATNCTEKGRDRMSTFPIGNMFCQKVFVNILLLYPDPREGAWQRNRRPTVGAEAWGPQPEGMQWTPSLDLGSNVRMMQDSPPSMVCLCCLASLALIT